jgi:Pin2-interacting protein X1
MTTSMQETFKTSLLDLAGSKLRKKLGSSLQESAAAPSSDFAKKQLEKMGWSEGTGLGKKRDGMKTHIRVSRREEQAGLGAEKAAAERQLAGDQWWKDGLGDTLARIGKKSKKGTSSKKRSRHPTDEELFEATGGARFGMRAAPTRKLVKWRRSEGDINNEASARGMEEAMLPTVICHSVRVKEESQSTDENAEVKEATTKSTIISKKKNSEKSKKKRRREATTKA